MEHAHPDLSGARAVAFDLDATLVDILAVKRAGARAAVNVLGAGDPEGMLDFALDTFVDREDIVEAYARERLGIGATDLLRRARVAFEQAEGLACEPYAGAHATLRALSGRGYVLALVTDAPRRQAIRRLQASGLARHFPVVVTGDETPRGKEDESPYVLAATRLGLTPERIVMVGDNPRLDVASAQRFGARGILALHGFQPALAGDGPWRPDAVIQNLGELLRFLPRAARVPGPVRRESPAAHA